MAFLVRVGTLAYWTPALVIDVTLLWRGGFGQEAGALVFWLLFREAVLFLAVWFGLGLIQALLFGRGARRARRRETWAAASTSVLIPNRDRRTH